MCTWLATHPAKHWPKIPSLCASEGHYGLFPMELNSEHTWGRQESFPQEGPPQTVTISVQRT